MRMQIESTEEVGELVTDDGARIPCRIWRGTTERGTACLLFISRIAIDEKERAEFEAELRDVTDSTTTEVKP